ncbi:MAG: hypothetical protein ABIF71_01470 [Planctomycetota bacterium]
MPWSTLGWWIAAMAAVMLIVLIAGVGAMLYAKNRMIIQLLTVKCAAEGVTFVIPPGVGVQVIAREGRAAARWPGVAAMTAYELIFVPRWGKSAVQLPMENITGYAQDPADRRAIIVHTVDARVTYTVRAPEGWADPTKAFKEKTTS